MQPCAVCGAPSLAIFSARPAGGHRGAAAQTRQSVARVKSGHQQALPEHQAGLEDGTYYVPD